MSDEIRWSTVSSPDAFAVSLDVPIQVGVLRRPYQVRCIRRRGRANLRALRRDWIRRYAELNPDLVDRR